ncbi:MAG: M1 family metallopeptidase [Vicinamibacterales bacterium]
MKRAALVLLAVLAGAGPAAAQRLPGIVVPEHYTLWLAPDLQAATFQGRETIAVQLKTPAREIVLHAAEIAFGDVTVTAGGREQKARVTLNARDETATLIVAQRIPAGPATLHIAFTGVLNDKLRGFYLSKANNRNYAVSQLEATDARRAFPSFDEPSFKATFDVSLMIDAGDTAISNGAQLSDIPGPEPGKHTVAFARTPRMSSYLVALIVGDFVCREGVSDNIPVRICSTPDKRDLTGFALEAAVQQLTFYNDYFGIKYPFGKLDIIAVPDFSAGAMENTGAIVVRERLLLADPDRASLGVRKNIAGIISHEIAHQWFGDLVTMKWWDDIWLNESFATWLANKPLAQWRPEWKVELDDVEDTLTAKATDALRTTRPVRMDVETPDQINEVFDAIAYEKGAGVLRMVESFVGPDLFRKGVASYLRKYAYSNAAAEDFWTEVARVTGKPVDRIMKTYIDQAGVPVVSVRESCVSGNTVLNVRQERFVGTPGAPPASAAQLWAVPVCFQPIGGGAPRCEVVDKREQTFTVPGCSVLIFSNAASRGYYFSEGSPEAVRALARTAGALAPSERLGLLGDEWWMARAGRRDIGTFLDVAAAFSADDTTAVIDQLRQRLGYVSEYLVPAPQLTRFEQWVRERFTPSLDTLGLPGSPTDPDDRQARRASLLALVGSIGNSTDVQRRARDMALKYIDDPNAIPGTLAPTVLQVAALAGDADLYERYLAQIRKPGADPEEYYRFFNALSWFRDPMLVRRTLELSMSPEVRTQDTSTLIGGLLGQPWSREMTWDSVRSQWSALTERLGTFQGIPRIVGAVQSFCSTEKAGEIRQFFMKNPIASSERTLRQSIERVETCAAVQARQSPALTTWLSAMR